MSSDSVNRNASSLLSIRNTSKKKKRRGTGDFPLVGKPRQVKFDHQLMAILDDMIQNRIEQRAISRAGATGTSTKTSEAITTMPPKIPPDSCVVRLVEAKLNRSYPMFSIKQGGQRTGGGIT